MYVCTCMYVCVCVYVCMYVCMYMCACMYVTEKERVYVLCVIAHWFLCCQVFLFHEEEIKQLELETSEDNENGRYQEVSTVLGHPSCSRVVLLIPLLQLDHKL